ncbi:hypothetical protein OJAV_G00115500 [Oryzias javanicus]|uniref:RNA helicase n=1 Tax=Oryzias javanicus TaxID=123683 RepID=A0A3S2Q1H7_ORYJA|nr:hypothetical protein OJAV_G00115500 [Oryzias javanicus]
MLIKPFIGAERRRRSALLLRRSPQKAAWTPQIQTEKQQKTAGVADWAGLSHLIQEEKAVPLALEEEDLLAGVGRSWGKNRPLRFHLQHILTSNSVREQAVRALVLVPTKEPGQQVQTMMRQLTSEWPTSPARRTFLSEVEAGPAPQNFQTRLRGLPGGSGRGRGRPDLLVRLRGRSQELVVPSAKDLAVLPDVGHVHGGRPGSEGAAAAQPRGPEAAGLQQSTIKCEEEDEFLLISTLLKLGLVRGKTLLFVGAVDRSYRKLKLFLEQFGIPASELPVQSRCHIITQFNQGFYDIIIATDEQSLSPPAGSSQTKGKEKKEGNNSESVLKPDQFRMEEIQGFRYRCRDAMRAVTKQAVREARLKEIKQEKLKTYFHDNPRDLQLLRHDKDLHPAVVKPHMKNIPSKTLVFIVCEGFRG